MNLTTRQEAVNTLLYSIGERPTNDTDTSGRLDVVRASSTLDEISRMVQTTGWSFNTVEELELDVDGDGEIVLPLNTLKILHLRGGYGFNARRHIFRRDSTDAKLKLYDIVARTFTIENPPLTVDLIEGLEFEDLPESARRYICLRAAVTFQARSVGSTILHGFTEAETQEAWVQLQRDEAEWQATQGTILDAPLSRDLRLLR